MVLKCYQKVFSGSFQNLDNVLGRGIRIAFYYGLMGDHACRESLLGALSWLIQFVGRKQYCMEIYTFHFVSMHLALTMWLVFKNWKVSPKSQMIFLTDTPNKGLFGDTMFHLSALFCFVFNFKRSKPQWCSPLPLVKWTHCNLPEGLFFIWIHFMWM